VSETAGARTLGLPRLHLRRADSTNIRARELARRGAPHGTLVTATEQTAGRGRQGRRWVAPAGSSLLCSLLVREPPRLLPLAAGVAVAETCDAVLAATPAAQRAAGSGAAAGVEAPRVARAAAVPSDPSVVSSDSPAVSRAQLARALIKWPNDVLLEERKVAGILVEARPQERWAVVGIGLNVALDPGELPHELRGRVGTLGLRPGSIELALARLLERLERWLGPAVREEELLDAVRARDALRRRPIAWQGPRGRPSRGQALGISDGGGLIVLAEDGSQQTLDAGEVHLLGGA
jgi:BirA family biotin operon repressor/biotin-[acetyl-CoA-carboxylase] ligase